MPSMNPLIQKILNESSKALGLAATFGILYGLHLNLRSLQETVDRLTAENLTLLQKLQNNEVTDLKNEWLKYKFELYKTTLENSNMSIVKEATKLKEADLKTTSTSNLDNVLGDIIDESTKSNQTVKDIFDMISSNNSNKFWGDFPSIKDLFNSWNDMLTHLDTLQLSALAHLLSSIVILLCIFSILAIVYSEFLLKYLKIEEKYPKLGKIIRVRRLFQHYYLIYNFTIILLILVALIYTNYCILFV